MTDLSELILYRFDQHLKEQNRQEKEEILKTLEQMISKNKKELLENE